MCRAPSRRRADSRRAGGARAVAVSPDGRNVYALAAASDTLVVFDRDAATGALRQKRGVAGCVAQVGTGDGCTGATGFDGLRSMAISADGNSVYVASWTDSDRAAVAVLDRDPVTGALTQKVGAAGCILALVSSPACASSTAFELPEIVQAEPRWGQRLHRRSAPGLMAFQRGPDGTLRRSCSAPGNALACGDEVQASRRGSPGHVPTPWRSAPTAERVLSSPASSGGRP